MNEAEASMHIFRLTDAMHALEKAVSMGYSPASGKLLRVKGWTDAWKDFEKISHNITTIINNCLESSTDGVIGGCEVETGVEYLDPSRKLLLLIIVFKS